MSANQQKQQVSATKNTLSTPLFSIEQVMRYQLQSDENERSRKRRQEEVDRQSYHDTMSNLIQLFSPGCEFDVNSLLPSIKSSQVASLLPAITSSSPVSSTSFSRATAATNLATVAENQQVVTTLEVTSVNREGNFSRHNPAVHIISLTCSELILTNNANESQLLCEKKFSTEEELYRHFLVKHNIKKYRCFGRGCNNASFDEK